MDNANNKGHLTADEFTKASARAMKLIENSGLPAEFIDKLTSGEVPSHTIPNLFLVQMT
jgi:hypothetical protein